MDLYKIKKNKYEGGSLLLELLLVISLIAIIFAVGTQAILVSLKSDKVSSEKDIASNLASETMELMRGVAEGNWQNIYLPSGIVKGTTHYFPLKVNNSWTLSPGDETVVINGISFTRSIIINNVSRDSTVDRKIETTYNSTDDDPNTQKITVTISWSGGNPVTIDGYLFRWRNKVCDQTLWSTQTTPVDDIALCSSSNYFSADSGIDTSTSGSLKLSGTTPKAITGTLISPVFDSGVASGAAYNSIMWKGSLGGAGANEGRVLLQIAGSSNPTGPWNYYGGSSCTSNDWFEPGSPNTPVELKGPNCLASWNNTEYYRYRIQICSSDCVSPGNNTPSVDDVIINMVP